MMNYPVVSLFSGAMGLDLGLKEAGLEILLSQDFNAAVGKTMEANGHNHVLGDIRELIENDPHCRFILDKIDVEKEDIFAVVGGPPCQSFSTIGKRGGMNDPRGSLFMEFAHVVDTLRPRFFVMENVKGLLSTKVNPEDKADTTTALDVILETFDRIGYSYTYSVLNAVNYGVPQFRERLIIIGSRDNEELFLPLPTHFQQHQNPAYRWKTVGDAISDLERDPGEYVKLSENRVKFLKYIPMGGNWKNLSLDLQEEALGGAFNSGGGKTGFYRRLNYSEPAPTLVTSPIQKSSMILHPIDDRPLSVKEYARIQQFPEYWKIMGSISDQYRQIGNAVPVGLGKAIGQTLLAIANNSSKIHSKRIKRNAIQDALANL